MNPKTVMVLGCNGLLGQRVSEFLVRGTSHKIVIAGRSERAVGGLAELPYAMVDITQKRDVRKLVVDWKPDVIINAAAMTNVDACETDRELAWKINVGGVENIIDAARRAGSSIVHFSTDYIFDGKAGPYSEVDRPAPLNYYGRGKLASENELRASGLPHVILRTMVLYGYGTGVKPNFALWLVRNLEERKPVRVVNDQTGNPTLVDDLAHAVVSAVELGKTGIYHIAGRDLLSRYDFALKLARVFGFDPDLVTPISTSHLKQPAQRPLKSGLITLKAEVELNHRPSTADEGLTVFKGQITRNPRRLPDSAPFPGRKR
jgi:dTDP-4-dehydrorhamnose reductase